MRKDSTVTYEIVTSLFLIQTEEQINGTSIDFNLQTGHFIIRLWQRSAFFTFFLFAFESNMYFQVKASLKATKLFIDCLISYS